MRKTFCLLPFSATKRGGFASLYGGTFCLLLPLVAEACPWCKDALWSPGDASTPASLARGYNLTILGLMAIPLLLVAGITALIVRSTRRHRRTFDTSANSD